MAIVDGEPNLFLGWIIDILYTIYEKIKWFIKEVLV